MGKIFRCTVCNYLYDENRENLLWDKLPEEWVCPICGSPRSVFVLMTPAETAPPPAAVQTVSDLLVRQMADWGIRYVFSIPGTSALGLVEALRKNPDIRYIQVRHEQAAAFMASAYGKLTGKAAGCLTVAGPGATNLATGLYDAKLDHAPVLALTGLVKRVQIGPGSFQEIDQQAFFDPICVYNKTLMSEEQTTTLVTLAIKHALLERGVAHISVPNDVQKLSYDIPPLPVAGRISEQAVTAPGRLIAAAAAVINSAQRPVIIIGHGAAGQGPEIEQLAEKISAPIVSTFRGKDIIGHEFSWYVGCHGTIGSTAAARVVLHSDLLIVIGCSFSDKTQLPQKKMIQIDLDPMMLGKQFPVEVGLWGAASELVPALKAAVTQRTDQSYTIEVAGLKSDWQALLEKEASDRLPLRPPLILKLLNQAIAADAIIALDVGEHCWWFGRNFQMRRGQRLLFSGYLAAMGFGLPAAIAAQLADPGRQVVCITGDGGFSMVMAEFMTAVKYNLPVKIFVFNNHQLGMIMQEQRVEGYQNWQTDLHNCDFAEFARSCGGAGFRVQTKEQLVAAIQAAFDLPGPVIVDIDTDPRRFRQ